MKTLGSLVAIFALAAVNGALTIGCGYEPASSSERAPVEFTASSVQAIRTPSTCGAAAAFTASDTFALVLRGDADVPPPVTTMALQLTPAAKENVSVPLVVSAGSPASSATTATTNDDSIQFSFTSGSDVAYVDGSPLDAVVVTVASLPTANGQPLSVELYLTFEDGRVLDQVYAAPLTSTVIPCPP